MQKIIKSEQYYEVVGIFESIDDLDSAVAELFAHGFNQAELSMLADEDLVKQKIGQDYKMIDLADNIHTPKRAFYAEENFGIAQGAVIGGLVCVATFITAGMAVFDEKPLALTIIITIIISSLIGIILATMIEKHHEKYLQKQIKKGGILLWVHLKDLAKQNQVMEIMQKYSAKKIHLRSINK